MIEGSMIKNKEKVVELMEHEIMLLFLSRTLIKKRHISRHFYLMAIIDFLLNLNVNRNALKY